MKTNICLLRAQERDRVANFRMNNGLSALASFQAARTNENVGLAEEAMQPGMRISFVPRRACIAPSQLFTWKRHMAEGGQARRGGG